MKLTFAELLNSTIGLSKCVLHFTIPLINIIWLSYIFFSCFTLRGCQASILFISVALCKDLSVMCKVNFIKLLYLFPSEA